MAVRIAVRKWTHRNQHTSASEKVRACSSLESRLASRRRRLLGTVATNQPTNQPVSQVPYYSSPDSGAGLAVVTLKIAAADQQRLMPVPRLLLLAPTRESSVSVSGGAGSRAQHLAA